MLYFLSFIKKDTEQQGGLMPRHETLTTPEMIIFLLSLLFRTELTVSDQSESGIQQCSKIDGAHILVRMNVAFPS